MTENLWDGVELAAPGGAAAAGPRSGKRKPPPALPAASPIPEGARTEYEPGEPWYIGGRLDPLGRPPCPSAMEAPICAAHARSKDGPCEAPAMVNAKGEWGRCFKHGGRSRDRALELKGVINGQQSALATERLVDRIERLSEDEDLASIEEQVALAASALTEFVGNLHKAGKAKLRRGEINDIMQMTKDLTQMTERRHKIREGQKYTVKVEVLDTMAQYVVDVVSETLKRHLSDQPALWVAISDEIAAGLANYKIPDGRAKVK